MEKEKNVKNYGIILMILAGLVLLGIISHWTYSTWIIIDWVTVIACGFIGYKLYEKDK